MKYSNFANTKVDLRSRAAMTLFLGFHGRYGTDYCQNVKIYNLNIPAELTYSAYAVLEESLSFMDVTEKITLFEAYHEGVSVGFEGRQNGYMLLHGAEDNQDFMLWEIAELRRVVRLVLAFDALVDDCVEAFMAYAQSYLDSRRQDAYAAGAYDKANALRFDLGLNDLPEYHAGYNLSAGEAQAYLNDIDDGEAFDGNKPDVGSLSPNGYAAGYAAGKVDAATLS